MKVLKFDAERVDNGWVVTLTYINDEEDYIETRLVATDLEGLLELLSEELRDGER